MISDIRMFIEEALKLGNYVKKKRKDEADRQEDETMHMVVDDLRRRASFPGAGNCLRPAIGSEQDRFCQKMVAKGYLKRVEFGYTLPEFGTSTHSF